MKHLSQEMKIPVILLSQLNREIEKDKRKPRLSDLRDSGQIEQDADWILFVHQKDGDHQIQDREITLAKQRDGDCGYWLMEFLREFQLFQRIDATNY
jgi:replicative DNA helicase